MIGNAMEAVGREAGCSTGRRTCREVGRLSGVSSGGVPNGIHRNGCIFDRYSCLFIGSDSAAGHPFMSQGPWGQGPSGPAGRGPRGNQPPDLEELIRKSQDRLKQILQGGGSSGSGFSRNLWMAIALIIGLAWAYMSTNIVDPDENGLVLRLGAYNRTAGPGPSFCALAN